MDPIKTWSPIKVAKLINKGDREIFPKEKLPDTKLSNEVFRKFLLINEPENQVARELVKDTLTVTEMEFHKEDFTESHCQMILDQDLESLELHSLKIWKIFHQYENGEMVAELEEPENAEEHLNGVDEIIYVDIGKVLRRILNDNSQKNLTKLLINGDGLNVIPGWFADISVLLPNLTTLDIRNHQIDDSELQSLCTNFPELKSLSLQGCKLTNLTGIHQLKSLEELDISCNKFQASQDLEDIFMMHNLKRLRIAGDISTNTLSFSMRSFIQCNKVLPNLEFLDCSYNNISQNMVDNLIKSHKTLKIIWLIGVPIRRNPKIFPAGRKLEILSTANLIAYIDSLEFFLAPENFKKEWAVDLVIRIRDVLEGQYKRNLKLELIRCLRLMCQFLPRLDRGVTKGTYHALEVLEILCRERRGEMFDYEDLQNMILKLLLVPLDYQEENPDKDVSYAANLLLWQILYNKVILYVNLQNFDPICLRAKHVVLTASPNSDVMIYAVKTLLLGFSTEYLTLRQRDALVNTRFIMYLLMILSDTEKTNIQQLEDLVHIIMFSIETKKADDSSEWAETEKMAICVIINHLHKFNHARDLQKKMVNSLQNILTYSSQRTLALFMKKEYLIIYTKLMYVPDGWVQLAVFTFLFTLYQTFLFHQIGSDIKDFSKLLVVAVEDVADVIREFKYTADSSILDIYRWIIEKSKSEITKQFARWIIKSYENAEGVDSNGNENANNEEVAKK